MANRRLLPLLLVAVTALVVVGCKSTPEPAPVTPPPVAEETGTIDVPASEDTPTVDSLKGVSLKDVQEGLIFDYLRAGGVAALESRWGKPTKSYVTAADEASTGSTEMDDGRVYLIQCGLDAGGKALVMAHSVEAKQGQVVTAADKAFIATIKDGVTTMQEANAYLAKAGGSVQAASVDPKALNVPAHVWSLADGTGFIIVDLTKLTPEQMAAIGMEDSGPWQALYWDASRWRAY